MNRVGLSTYRTASSSRIGKCASCRVRLLARRRVLLEVPVKPVQDRGHVAVHFAPAVARSFFDNQFRGHANLFQSRHHHLRLLDGHQLVRVTVDNQRRRSIGADVRYR